MLCFANLVEIYQHKNKDKTTVKQYDKYTKKFDIVTRKIILSTLKLVASKT